MPLPCGLLDTLLLLGVLCRLPIVMALLLGLWLLLFRLVLLLGMLLWLLLSMLRLRLSMLLLLFWLGFLLSVLCEGRNNGSKRQKQDYRSEICKCFH